MNLNKSVFEYTVFCRWVDEMLETPAVRQMDGYIQHGTTSCLCHSIGVAYYSAWLCGRLGRDANLRSVVRGALLHDLFLYDWHEKDESHRLHGFTHPGIALTNASKLFELDGLEREIIRRHMWPLTPRPPRHMEALVVCLTDKCCSSAEALAPLFGGKVLYRRLTGGLSARR